MSNFLLRRRITELPLANEPQDPNERGLEAQDDEIARALKDAMRHKALLAETAQAIASGDLARDVLVSSEADTLGVAFREMLGGLRRLVGQAKDASADVDAGAQAVGGA